MTRGLFVEALGAEEGKAGARAFRIRVIQGGPSLNGNFYPDALLRESAGLFAGVRVFVKGDAEHLAGQGRDVRNLIGRLTDPRFVEAAGDQPASIEATLELLEPDGPIARKLREAWDRGMTDLFGFSIDAAGVTRSRRVGNRTLREASKFLKVDSVDLIVQAGAGGAVLRLVEAADPDRTTTEPEMRNRLIRLIEAANPQLLAGKDREALTDDELEALLREATVRREPAPDPAAAAAAALEQATARFEARAAIREAVGASRLPEAGRARVRERLDEQVAAGTILTGEQIREAVTAELNYLTQAGTGGQVVLPPLRIETGETRAEKTAAMLDAFFDPAHKDHRHARSFRECYVQITGDRMVSGQLRECDQGLLREALDSGSFAEVLGDSISRRMLRDYAERGQYDIWQRVADVVPVNDFRTQHRTRWGGYGDLPIVQESDPYLEVDSPTDEEATYAVAKRGGIESVTLEMIANDDVGVIRRIPGRLARAAKRTLGKFVLDFIQDNPVIYDGVALFHADHGNLGSTALGAASLAAGRLAMLKQTEQDSGEPLMIGPKSLLVPPDLEEDAADLFRRATENDKTFVQSLSLDILPVWYWTDANNWSLAADPMDIPTIEVGFLNGRQEPELLVQDNPTAGSMFSNDKLSWKIRHIYGGNVTDYRGLYKSVVAGG